MTHVRLPKRPLSLLLVISAIAVLAVPATAQSGFLQIGDIAGESTDSRHRGWIDILSVSYEWGTPDGRAAGQSRRRGQVTYGDLVVVKEIDASTPMLINALSRGIVSQSATIDLVRGSSVVLKYELTNVIVTSHSMKDGREQVSISFESMRIVHPASARETIVETSSPR